MNRRPTILLSFYQIFSVRFLLRPLTESECTIGRSQHAGFINFLLRSSLFFLLLQSLFFVHTLAQSSPLQSSAFPNVVITIPDTSVKQLTTFDLPILISDVTSRGIISTQWKLNFNPNTLEAIGVLTTGSMTKNWVPPTVNYGSGFISVAMAGSDTLTGSGILAFVRLKVKRYATEASVLSLTNVMFNENIFADVTNGNFIPIAGPVISISPNLQILTRGDSIFYNANGGTPPYKWFSSDTTKASVDTLTGKVKAKNRGNVLLTAYDAQGFDGSLALTVNDFLAMLRDTSVRVVDSVTVPLIITDVTGLGILSKQIKISYDTTMVRFSSLVNSGTISGTMTAAPPVDSAGIIRLSFSSATPISGSGLFALLRFKHKAPSGPGQISPLIFTGYKVNIPGPTERFATLKNGSISILPKLNINPVFTKAMGDTTIKENETLYFYYTAYDADNDPLKFSVENKPPGMVIDSVTGLLYWTPNFNQAGNYAITVKVSDGNGGSASKITNITVLNTNQKPVITTPLPTTSIAVGFLFTFQFNATDPENDQLIWSAVNLPPGAQFSSSGFLQWRPTFVQAGQGFSISVSVTDGINTVSHNFLLTVFDDNHPPVFSKFFSDTTIAENQQLQFTFQATDVDGDIIVYSLQNAAPGMSITSASGIFSWTPTFSQSGLHTVSVVADDKRGMNAVKNLSITVLDLNRPPVFTKVPSDTTISEGQPLLLAYKGFDDDGDSLFYSIISSPVNGMSIDKNGLLNWIPDFSQSGLYTIVVRLSDQKLSVLDTAVITVLNVNRSPQFVSTLPDFTIPVDTALNFIYKAVDPDNDILTFSLVKSPVGSTVQADGSFFWRPTSSQLGIDTIIVSVSDGLIAIRDTAVLTVIGYPTAEVSQTNFDFGSIPFGGTKTLTTIVRNRGIVPLLFRALSELNKFIDPNFVLDTAGKSFIPPGEERTIGITYKPKSVGGHGTQIKFATNDPKNPSFSFNANGSAIAKLVVTKRVLVDTLHNSTVALSDTVQGIGQIFNFLRMSGIQISFTGAQLRPSGHDILLLLTPQRTYSRQEIDSVKRFVNNGGVLLAIGNSGVEGSNAALNALLTDTTWTTGLRINNDLVLDSIKYFFDATELMLTTFADKNHPFLSNVDTLVFIMSASVSISGSAVPFISTSPNGKIAGQQNPSQPAVAGYSKIGKGKIMALGDIDLWSVESQSGLRPPNIALKDNLTFLVNLFSVSENYEVKLPGKTPSEQYRLVSIPFDLANFEITSVLKDLGGVNPLIWRLFGRFDPAAGKYSEFPSERFKTFRRGEAYWLITRGEFSINFGNTTVIPVKNFYPIKIGPGYSMIGNPFSYKVSWKNSIHDSVESRIWRYDGTSFKAESLALEPFTGYFVKNLTKDSLTIFINPEDISASTLGKNTAVQFGEKEWRIGISAVSGKSADEDNFAGVSSSAAEEYDRFDLGEPPATPTDYVIVRFNNTHWKEQPGSYAMDIRPVNDEGLFWDFDVTTAKANASVALTLAQFGDLPGEFSSYIIDKNSERAVPIGGSSTYDFTMNKNETRRNFRLVAGKKEFVEKNTQGIPLVAMDFALLQNYPNPFNPVTQIRYSLGRSGHVSLSIYNVLGQRVRSLRSEFQMIGSRSAEWDGMNDAGAPVATGVYFYTVTVTSNNEKVFTSTKKMILIK